MHLCRHTLKCVHSKPKIAKLVKRFLREVCALKLISAKKNHYCNGSCVNAYIVVNVYIVVIDINVYSGKCV